MKRSSFASAASAAALAAALLGAALPARAAENTVVLGVPSPATLRATTDVAQNAWLASNPNFAAEACFSALAATSRVTAADKPQCILASAETGFPLERTVPEYYLGDELSPPEGVDWPATYAAFTNSPDAADFIFDTADERVFASQGGTHSFTWVLEDGSRVNMNYVVSPSCSGRPRRIYWTDSPWNAPAIDLTGKFVKFFGSRDITVPVYGTATNYTGGIKQVVSNQVLSGLVLDPSTHMLSAHGQLQGQAVMVYYDTGNYERILHVQVVEVCRPAVNRLRGDIGRALRPDGRGYDVAGLRPRPTVVSPSDDRGEYLYQHRGQHSYSPKHNNVYPLRPTVDCPWNAEVYWMETDEMEVEWPFELDQYACDWPEDTTVFVRGDVDGDAGRPVYVPYGLGATVMPYQEPDGHARAVGTDGAFTTVGEGYSLLKLTADDDVWFFPIRSVFRGNTDFFTLESAPVRAGLELALRGGAASGRAEGFAPDIDGTSPGYIYPAASGTHYNPDLYKAPAPDSRRTSDTASATNAAAGDTNEYASVIYAVRADGSDGKGLEVWWNTVLQEEGMADPLVVPTLPQVYSVRWPEAGETPEIVLASQLGSGGESVFSHNRGLRLEASDSTVRLPTRAYFGAAGGTIMFWVRGETPSEHGGTILSLHTLGDDGTPTGRLTLDYHRGSGYTSINYDAAFRSGANSGGLIAIPDDGKWHHVAIAFDTEGFTKCVDGKNPSRVEPAKWEEFLGPAVSATIGAVSLDGEHAAAAGASLGEILFWNTPLSGEEIASEMHKTHTAAENHLRGCFSFAPGTDFADAGGGECTVTEKVSGAPLTAYRCSAAPDGPPATGTGEIACDEGTTPKVYVQNDPAATGYNPNEEHAFVTTAGGKSTVWAFRCDLNTASSSEPGVLVEYVTGGRKAMQWFGVVATNAAYPELAGTATAGLPFPGPHPFDLLDDPWCPSDAWDEALATAPAFRDRKGQLWARAAGTATMRMYYRNQEGFAFPSLTNGLALPAVGAEIPWLSLLDGDANTDPMASAPHPWIWTVSWPDSVPEMAIGRTLTTAADGLPEVWNARSAAVVWPATDDERDATAVLFDPTVAQKAGLDGAYDSLTAAIKDLGIKTGAGGHATLRNGKYFLDNLPPNLSKRFYIDTTADLDSCLKLVGEKEDNPGGVSLLHVNVLNEAERRTLAAAVDDTASEDGRKAWAAAIGNLATDCVLPSPHKTVSTTEDRVAYEPRDHYALFSMGGTGYVTLIENDSTNELMNISPGDPISMHVIKVVPKYHVGRVVTREDPLNLLSQQLSILYAESFAGRANDYVFEWVKHRPEADGSVPTNFPDYEPKFPPTAGLTRFVIGEQGDTLPNMVNTYYAVRYRAASSNSPAFAAMSTNWSAWSDPPALAEGWVQRVLNNVTPFYQRMRDLYDNPVEDDVSMVVQAGAPYEGDVALNQDNLTSVGLIQLYETLLSKAETMSLSLGIDDPDANKQLQLAVGRLADMYGVLGDEAWCDALNPTIGFGANFDSLAMTGFELDYGALSSSLFAFDNQVPTLLDEELALLRGRSGATAPSTRVGPYYNRLVWNFTRGITAGEVAYAVNYDTSGTRSGTIDAQQAAKAFPQGHGDAYGHYLSALSAYYRLLRNPCFTWGPPAMGELVVADSVVNADEYDEAHFAQVAYDVAKVAAETVDRTARKAYRDNGGARSAGYLDSEAGRNFGYGEWAARGGYGALCNWAVANSLLPAAPDAGRYVRFAFTNRQSTVMADFRDSAAPPAVGSATWTVEFQLVPSDPAVDPLHEGAAVPVAVDGEASRLEFRVDAAGGLSVALQPMAGTNGIRQTAYFMYTNANWSAEDWEKEDYSEIAWTNEEGTVAVECGFLGTDAPSAFPSNWVFASFAEAPDFSEEGWNCASLDENGNLEPLLYDTVFSTKVPVGEARTVDIGTVPSGEDSLVALVSEGGTATALVVAADGALAASVPVPFAIDPGTLDSVSLGNGFQGEIGEFRLWNGVARTVAELHAKRECVSPLSEGLALSLRTVAPRETYSFADEADTSVNWVVWDGGWIQAAESGMSIDFGDEGLKRIDRGSVTALRSLASLVPDIQKKLDRLDAGLNPLGLSSAAIPFDITPVAGGDEGRTHFEQIRERAGTAVENARRILERAQEAGNRLRLIQEAQVQRDDLLESTEQDFKHRLIEYFGYPYEGDIGPGGTYAQGYDGPDLIHFAWMDLDDFGIEEVKDKSTNTTVCLVGATNNQNFATIDKVDETNTFTFTLSANGFILKPDSITGRRRAQGRIQDALADFLLAYADLQRAQADYDYSYDVLVYEAAAARRTRDFQSVIDIFKGVKSGIESVQAVKDAAVKCTYNSLETASKIARLTAESIGEMAPQIAGAGMTVNVDPSAVVKAANVPGRLTAQNIFLGAMLAAKNDLDGSSAINTLMDIAEAGLDAAYETMEVFDETYCRIRDAADAQYDAMCNVKSCWKALQVAQANVETVIAEAQRILDERLLVREQAVDVLTKMRYNEMFFRLDRNAALSRYASAFELAQKYVYLAAQAYDYETGLLAADPASGEQFIARIVGARTLGEFDEDGKPLPTSDGVAGDGGLASILAELDANWLVLKPRLGINNPQRYATWFSLRKELFRIYGDERGDEAWKTALRKCWVDDLSKVPEFSHRCQPLAGSTADAEPGLVIPFPSMIAFGRNFFGEETKGGDSALDPTYFATHIASAGVHFAGYDDSILAKTPSVYLVPAGEDRIRAVGDPDRVLSWNVVDQVVPAPYAIGSTQLDDPDWTPLYTGATGGNDLGAKIRKHPSFRAYYDEPGKAPSDDSLDCTRLVGRSAWNTKWLLVIPAGSLGADRETALSAFIDGIDADRDGTPDAPGVSDILLGLKTYSTSGN